MTQAMQGRRWCGLCGGTHERGVRCPRSFRAPSPDRMIQPDDWRIPASERGYDAAWRRVRNAYLAAHPLCEACLPAGRYTTAVDVDHIVPIAADPARRLDAANLQALCRSCHNAKTAREQGRVGEISGALRREPPRERRTHDRKTRSGITP